MHSGSKKGKIATIGDRVFYLSSYFTCALKPLKLNGVTESINYRGEGGYRCYTEDILGPVLGIILY